MDRPRASTLAWAGIAAGVYAYDRFCPAGEQLSERADEWMEHPLRSKIFLAAVGTVALHLTNVLPAKYDPISRILAPKKP